MMKADPGQCPPLNSMAECDIETTGCPLCQSFESSVLHTFPPFHLVRCGRCGLHYLNPRPKEEIMRAAYRNDDYFSQGGTTGYQDYRDQEESLRLTFRRFLERLNREGLTGGRLLEVGSGYGFFLSEAREFFTERYGVELSPEAAGEARKRAGVEVFESEIHALSRELTGFDVIVSINVIEHIYRPAEFLLSLKERLAKGGRIVLATPDIGSLWYVVMGRKWPSLKIPEHVVFYARHTLRLLFEKTGFQRIQEIPFAHAFPLGLVAAKLGIPLPEKVGGKSVWMPQTMIALCAEVQ